VNCNFSEREFAQGPEVRFSLIAAGQLGRKLSLFSVGDDQEKCKQAVK